MRVPETSSPRRDETMADFERERGSLLPAESYLQPSSRATRPWASARCLLARFARSSVAVIWILATLLAFLLLVYTRRARAPGPAGPEPGEQLALALHPEACLTRGAADLVFNWTITAGKRAPDGVQKQVYLVNGLFPGPTIEACSGDRIVINVFNGLPSEGISLHWHCLRMKGHNGMDGAVGFTQCPIPPATSFTYNFALGHDEHDTFWWHGHSLARRSHGLYGGLIVHQQLRVPESSADQEALLLIGDWFHRSQSDVIAWYAEHGSLGNEPVPDSLLINGRGRFECFNAVPARPVVCDQLRSAQLHPIFARRSHGPTRLRLVNTGTVAGWSLAVDGASLEPVAADGAGYVRARPRRSIGILYPGERIDAILRWDASREKQPRLRIYLDDENLNGFLNEALSQNQNFLALPTTGSGLESGLDPLPLAGPSHCNLGELRSASPATTVLPPKAQQTILLYLKTQRLSRFSNRPMGFINHTSWKAQTPLLLSLNRSSWDSHQLLPFVDSSTSATTVELIVNNLDDGSHPIHLHGNSFYLVSSHRAAGRDGWGSYSPFESDAPPRLVLENPVSKDTVAVPRRGHVILRLTADNPGLWMLHCHMLVHAETGMVAGLHVGENLGLNGSQVLDPFAARLCK